MGNSGSKPPQAKLDKKVNGVAYKLDFDTEPFDKGACRLAFKGAYRGKGSLNGNRCVTKVFIDEAKRQYESYQPDMKASEKASELAEAFNSKYVSTKPLRFVLPKMATVTRCPKDNKYVKTGDKILVEDFIEGKYEKFNSNGGWQTNDVAGVPAFSHFTYCESQGAYLVCDIQGVRNTDGYTLTDPAVHSRNQGEYGPTDLGPTGMARFFESHRCTRVCSQFAQPQFNENRMINKGRQDRRASSYTFMLGPGEKEANRFYQNRTDLPAIME